MTKQEFIEWLEEHGACESLLRWAKASRARSAYQLWRTAPNPDWLQCCLHWLGFGDAYASCWFLSDSMALHEMRRQCPWPVVRKALEKEANK